MHLEMKFIVTQITLVFAAAHWFMVTAKIVQNTTFWPLQVYNVHMSSVL